MASRLSRIRVSMSSMAVMYILEIMPMEQTLWVMTPQAAPGPVTRIHISAQTRLGMVRISRISTRNRYATGLGMMFSDARNAKGIARMAPNRVPRMAMAMVCSRRYGTSVSPRPNSRSVSGWKMPETTPLATEEPVAVRPLKCTSEADQPTSSARIRTMAVYSSQRRGRRA